MSIPRSHRSFPILVVVVLICGAATVFAQEPPLAKAKALYDSAAYEEALTVLASVEDPEAQQYRALCMLALDRAQDATNAVDLLVSTAPLYEPSSEDFPPRFASLVSEAKKRLVPGIARKTFNEARDQFRSGDREKALKKFDFVLTLTATAGFKETSEAEDLRTLASGFVELERATAAARAETTATEPKATESRTPDTSAPEPAAAPTIAGSANPGLPTEVSQPVVIRQTIPAVPPGIAGMGSPTATVRVEIGADGKVIAASMQQNSHPLYDRLVLQAAREWLYMPAMLNGRPVASEKVVNIQLR
jgi:hypothetical protein